MIAYKRYDTGAGVDPRVREYSLRPSRLDAFLRRGDTIQTDINGADPRLGLWVGKQSVLLCT